MTNTSHVRHCRRLAQRGEPESIGIAGNVSSERAAYIDDTLTLAAQALPNSPSPRLDAEVLLAHALKKQRTWLYAHGNELLDGSSAAAFHDLIRRRANGEPIAYLTGTREFWSLPLTVNPAVLIPRPESELLVELALTQLRKNPRSRVVDLGTGSGCIALAIASERPNATVVATDVSSECLSLAADNAAGLGLQNVELRLGSWLKPLANERFDLIVSNPPYVEANDPHLKQGDVQFEPKHALVAGIDGLDAIRIIIKQAPSWLNPGGCLLLEHGWNQHDAVQRLFKTAGFENISTHLDFAGQPRVTMAQRD